MGESTLLGQKRGGEIVDEALEYLGDYTNRHNESVLVAWLGRTYLVLSATVVIV